MGPVSCCRSSKRRVGVANEAFILGVSAGMSTSERLCVSHQPFTNYGLFKNVAVKLVLGEGVPYTLLRQLS